MNRIEKAAFILLTSTFTLSFLATIPTAFTVKGPRSEDLIFYYYNGVESAYSALKAGQIDLVAGAGYSKALIPAGLLDAGGLITAELFVDASADPNIVTAPVSALNMYQIDLNNNWTIPEDPGVRSPMTYLGFRQALAMLTDKDWVVEEACGGFAERIDQPIPAPLKAWANTSLWYPHYSYEYDPTAAATMLDAAGFAQGATPNPDYDATFPGSAQYIRTYPTDHTLAGQDLHAVIACVRNDDIHRLEAGRLLDATMRKMGIPVNSVEGGQTALYDRVMGDRNYHLYTGAWTCGRFPTHVCFDYHSDYRYAYGPNYVTGVNASNQPNYPDLDAQLDAMHYAVSYDAAVVACKNAMGLFTEHCITIPLWSDHSYAAWSKDLLGVVPMNGYGPINPYTFMNAYKTDGSTVMIGTWPTPEKVNIVYSSLANDYACLDPMNLYGGVDVPPYNLAQDQTGFVTDWNTTTWDDDGELKTLVHMDLRNDAFFCKPVSGDPGEHVNSTHMFWNAYLSYEVGDAWDSPSFRDLHHVEMTGPYSYDIYFNTLSYWHTYHGQGAIRPMDLWMNIGDDFISQAVETVAIETVPLPETPLPIDLTHDPIWISSVILTNETGAYPIPCITECAHPCYIILGDFYVNPVYAGVGNYTVTYNYVANATALRGFTPGGLPWQTIFEGAGAWYATAFTPGVGGSLALQKNPFYYMETPRLGEIDWIKKINGAYKIDIYDVVMAAGAYGSQGIGVPSTNWFAGADVAPEGGKIDIFDIVTITGKYGEEWDRPS